MADLTRRATDREWLDTGVPPQDAIASLADLRLVGRWLSGRRSVLAAVRAGLDGMPSRVGHLLDVGCGSADLPAWIRSRSALAWTVVGLDLKPLHLTQTPADIHRVAGDVRALPFEADSFDMVIASLLLHHFDQADAAAVLRELFRVTRRLLIVHDLRRARAPYVFGRLAFPLLFRSRVSVVDGLISIRRAYTPPELARAFTDAGITAEITRVWPYRLLAVARKPA